MPKLPPEIVYMIMTQSTETYYQFSLTCKNYYQLALSDKNYYIHSIIDENLPSLISTMIAKYCLCIDPSVEYIEKLSLLLIDDIFSRANVNALIKLIMPLVNSLDEDLQLPHKLQKLIISIFIPSINDANIFELITGTRVMHNKSEIIKHVIRFRRSIMTFMYFISKLVVRYYKKIYSINDLPLELIQIIMNCNSETYVGLSHTCRQYRELAQQNTDTYVHNRIMNSMNSFCTHMHKRYCVGYYPTDELITWHINEIKKVFVKYLPVTIKYFDDVTKNPLPKFNYDDLDLIQGIIIAIFTNADEMIDEYLDFVKHFKK